MHPLMPDKSLLYLAIHSANKGEWAQMPLFADLPPAVRKGLVASARKEAWPEGGTIVQDGEVADRWVLLP
jgi:hypothetical protein